MIRRNSVLGLLFGTLLSFSVSCIDTEPGAYVRREGPIPGITLDVDGPAEVEKVLGKPNSVANGWWMDEHRFNMEFRVWYYSGIGRVVFDRYTSKVFATEADKSQEGQPN